MDEPKESDRMELEQKLKTCRLKRSFLCGFVGIERCNNIMRVSQNCIKCKVKMMYRKKDGDDRFHASNELFEKFVNRKDL